MQLHTFSVELLLDNELVVAVRSGFNLGREGVEDWTASFHLLDDVPESSFESVAEHGDETTEGNDRRVLFRVHEEVRVGERSVIYSLARQRSRIGTGYLRRERHESSDPRVASTLV